MRTCHVWDADYPWDVRVEKIARGFTLAGHEVVLVARNRRRAPIHEHLPEGDVHRLRPYRWLPPAADDLLMFPAFFNPRWLHRILEVARSQEADVLICRDLPLAPAALWAARRLRRPLVLDMAENYPAMLQARWDANRMKSTDHLVRSPRAAGLIEDWVLPEMDGILAVVEESRDRLLRKGIAFHRLEIVSNTPPLSRLEGPRAWHEGTSDILRVVYLGLLELPRGVGTLVEAVAGLRSGGLGVQLTIIGDGADAWLIRARARELGCGDSGVEFRGRMRNSEALRELARHHIGVVPHWRNESWDTTVPNKLFDYMAAGLAVVTSDAVPAARIVRETGAGEVFEDRNAGELAAVLARLADPAVRCRHAAAGRRAIAERYNWEQDEARMLAFVERVVSAYRR